MILRKVQYNCGYNFSERTFDHKGNMISRTENLNGVKKEIKYNYDENNRLVTEYICEIDGYDVGEYRKDYKYENRTTRIFKYEKRSKSSSGEDKDNSTPKTYELNVIEEIYFDSKNRKISEKYINIQTHGSSEILYQYSSENLTAIIEDINYQRLFEFNNQNQIIKLTEINPHVSGDGITSYIYNTDSHIIDSDKFIITKRINENNIECEKSWFSKEDKRVTMKTTRLNPDFNRPIEILLNTFQIKETYSSQTNISLTDIFDLPKNTIENDYANHYDWNLEEYLTSGVNSLKIIISFDNYDIKSIKLINPENDFIIEEKFFINRYKLDKNRKSFPVFTCGIWRKVDNDIVQLFTRYFEYF